MKSVPFGDLLSIQILIQKKRITESYPLDISSLLEIQGNFCFFDLY